MCSVPYWSVRFDSKDICGHVPPGTIKNCEIYLSFCQILPISETDPAGFCRVVGEETHLPKNTSACMVLNGTLDNDTTTTFGTYNPNEQPFQALDIGMYAFLFAWGEHQCPIYYYYYYYLSAPCTKITLEPTAPCSTVHIYCASTTGLCSLCVDP